MFPYKVLLKRKEFLKMLRKQSSEFGSNFNENMQYRHPYSFPLEMKISLLKTHLYEKKFR